MKGMNIVKSTLAKYIGCEIEIGDVYLMRESKKLAIEDR